VKSYYPSGNRRTNNRPTYRRTRTSRSGGRGTRSPREWQADLLFARGRGEGGRRNNNVNPERDHSWRRISRIRARVSGTRLYVMSPRPISRFDVPNQKL